nr:putative late blight resistance protein homolog R1A-3 [Ipomoea batatas]
MMPNISNPDNAIVVGFKKEEETIIEYLIHGSDEREVILITGMGGLGKTTLAKRVYEEKNVLNHFDKHAWCTISQEYDCKDLLCKIYSQVCNSEIEINSVAEVLRKKLMEMRYLIVLDDIWSLEAWEEFNRVFPSCDNGSRIVLTSRQESVVPDAKHICLPFFTTDESWELLQVKLFKGKGCLEELENVGRKISKKCRGLPLTVDLMVGLLEKVEKSEQMWREFLLTLNSHVRFGDGIQSNDAIELSYKYLSNHLKPCLLYFAAFPEDEVIQVSKLIELWISEGFIIGMTEKGRVEDEAEDYLNHLVCSNLIMVSEKEYDGHILSCTIHDLVRDFCLTKAREDISLKVINMEKKWDPTLNFTPHRICFHLYGTSHIASELVPQNSSMHTVLVFHNYTRLFYNASWIVKKIEHLTILDLEAICVYQSFLYEVSLLTHLRSCMKKSRSAMIEATSPCSKELQTWVSPCPLTPMHEDLLRKLPYLKNLRCGVSSSSKGFPEIDFLHHLENLVLSSDFGSFPLSKFPSSIKKIHLCLMTLSVSAISTIARLSNLEILILFGCKFEEALTWIVEEETKFPKLKILQLVELSIEIWYISNAAESFPCLEQLVLEYCRNLILMPSSFDDVLTLKKIFANHCNNNVDSWVKNIEESARGIGNEQLNVVIRSK